MIANKLVSIFALVALVAVGVLGFAVAWNTPTLQAARADAIRLNAQAEADKVAQQTEAQKTRDALAAQATTASMPAEVLGRQLAYVGAGAAVALLLIGLALAFVAWATLKASTIQPNAAGQFPLVRVAGFGFMGFVDPNRLTGLTVFKTPTIFDLVGDVAARLKGRGASLPGPEVSSPLALSEAGHLTLTAQASAVAMTAAATRFPQTTKAADIRGAAEILTTQAATLTLPLPTVTRIDDASHIDRLIQLESEVTDED